MSRIFVVAASVAVLVSAGSPVQAHSVDDAARERAHIEERARSVLGTRYTYGGGSPNTGFDCSGFTSWVFRGHGAELPHSSMDQFQLAGRNGANRVWQRKNLKRGDLVFFKTTDARVGHAGIYLSRGSFIHSSSAGGSVQISTMNDGYYRERFVGATRLRATRN